MATLLGRYEIVHEIARDGAGRLLGGRETGSQRDVTLRVLDALASASPESRRAVLARMEDTIARLIPVSHPGVLHVVAQCEIEDRPVLVTPAWEGEPLARFCRAGSLLPIDEAVELVASAAETLDAAERGGVVHGHVRPSNLLRAARGRVRVGDFGVAAALRAGGIEDAVLEGGAGYAPPENVRGGLPTGRGDQFSLAAVLFELLGGEPAFPGHDAASVVYRLVNEPPRDPRQLPRPIPAALVVPLFRALLKQPQQRYGSGAEFAAALRGALGRLGDEEKAKGGASLDRSHPRSVASPPARRGPSKSGDRGRWPWVVLALLLAVAIGARFRDRLGFGERAAREVWAEARVRVEPPEAALALDGAALDGGPESVVRFRTDGGQTSVLTATLGCRTVERPLEAQDAAGSIVLDLPPSRLDWKFEPQARGARVSVNGATPRDAPVDVALDLCQDNRLDVRAAGFLPASITIPAGATVPEARAHLSGVRLAPIPVGRLVLPEVAGVKLVWFVDGRRVSAEERELELAEGVHELRFKNDFHWLDRKLDVEVVGGGEVRPDVRDLAFAELVVQAFPPNARVYLRRAKGEDWRYLDETPATRRVDTGRYEIKIESVTSGRSEVREVTLKEGDNPPVRVSFGAR